MFELANLYSLGIFCGRASLVLYIATLIPGICRRLKIKHRTISLATLYRRQLGIAMYVFAILHTVLFLARSLRITTPKFFGIAAVLILLPLFTTSSNYAVRKLKSSWKKIHQLTYVAAGLIFLHVALIRVSVYSIAILAIFILLIASFIVENLRKGSAASKST